MSSWDIQCKAIHSAIAKAAVKGDPVDELTHRLEELYSAEPEEPHSRQFLVNDSTTADLKYKLRHPLSSVGIFSDEAKLLVESGLLRNLALHNKLWDGGTLSVGRRTSESFLISDVRVTTSLGIQPEQFHKHFISKKSEARGIGYLARTLIAYPLSTIGSRIINHPATSFPRLSHFHDRIAELLRLEQSAIESGTHTRKLLKFSWEAQQRWTEFYNLMEYFIGPGAPLSDVSDFGSKLGDNVARIAAMFHYFEGQDGNEISLDTVNRAINVSNWYGNEFRRLFSLAGPVLPQEQLDAITLEGWLIKYFIKHRCSWIEKSYMERNVTNPIRPSARLSPAINLLIQRGLMTNTTDPPLPGRKPKIRFSLNAPYFENAARTQTPFVA